jgi:hypothetical protein
MWGLVESSLRFVCLNANALIVGHWYYGNAVSLLKGKYVYGDWTTAKLFALTLPDRTKLKIWDPFQNFP